MCIHFGYVPPSLGNHLNTIYLKKTFDQIMLHVNNFRQSSKVCNEVYSVSVGSLFPYFTVSCDLITCNLTVYGTCTVLWHFSFFNWWVLNWIMNTNLDKNSHISTSLMSFQVCLAARFPLIDCFKINKYDKQAATTVCNNPIVYVPSFTAACLPLSWFFLYNPFLSCRVLPAPFK